MGMLEEALRYAKKGLPVLPLHTVSDGVCTCGNVECGSVAKHPRNLRGVTEATTDEAIINQWWEQWPGSNIGLATGTPEGILVVDVDAKSGGLESWMDLQDIHGVVNTLMVETGGGGNHYIFKQNGTIYSNTAGKLGQGIDTRGKGGYIVAPPSVHASGDLYKFFSKDVTPQDLPGWIAEKWGGQSAPAQVKEQIPGDQKYDAWVDYALEHGAPEGQRNDMAHRLAGYFRRFGLPVNTILTIMIPYNERCTPPMPLSELRATINSAERYAIQVDRAGISDAPEFREEGGVLFYTWDRSGLTVKVDQLTRVKNGSSCMISFEDKDPETKRTRDILGPVSYNMNSVTARKNLGDELGKQRETSWRTILQTLGKLTDEYLRSGQDVVDLRDYMDRPFQQWSLEPLILNEDLPVILFGDGGLGKSLVALAAMTSLNTGTDVLPGLYPAGTHNGLYLDWESSPYENGERYKQLMKGRGLDPTDYKCHHIRCSGTFLEMASSIRQKISEYGITFLIIDSAAMAVGGEPRDESAVVPFFNALRSMGIPSLIIAHQRKEDTSEMPFGSVFWKNEARSTWEIKRHQEVGDNMLQIGLYNRKNNFGLTAPLGFELEFGDDTIEIYELNIQEVPELAKSSSIWEQIKGQLTRNGRMTSKQLSDETGEKMPSISQTLHRYKERGKVELMSAQNDPTQMWQLKGE